MIVIRRRRWRKPPVVVGQNSAYGPLRRTFLVRRTFIRTLASTTLGELGLLALLAAVSLNRLRGARHPRGVARSAAGAAPRLTCTGW